MHKMWMILKYNPKSKNSIQRKYSILITVWIFYFNTISLRKFHLKELISIINGMDFNGDLVALVLIRYLMWIVYFTLIVDNSRQRR